MHLCTRTAQHSASHHITFLFCNFTTLSLADEVSPIMVMMA